MSTDMSPVYRKAIEDAIEAAERAGVLWMKEATERGPKYAVVDSISGRKLDTLLDLCGNAYLYVTDKRTTFGRFLKKELEQERGFTTHRLVLPIMTKYHGRQEYGLKVAMMEAAQKVLREDYGIKGISMHSYID